MKILVVGGGGREHALVWKISQSPKVKKVFCAPGNAGIAKLAECAPISAEDVEGLCAFAKKNSVDLTVVGPEAALTAGIADRFIKEGLAVFGPTASAARLEGSKSFAKALMEKYSIPTAKAAVFTDPEKAFAHLEKIQAPVVIKADGLAAGKGVMVCPTIDEARQAISHVMVEKRFGQAGALCVIEEFLEGEEASFLAFTDGETVLPLPPSQDHKAAYDNDQGPNTGGMGAYSPAPVVDPTLFQDVMDGIMIPTVKALAAEGIAYQGVLYAGLMIKDGAAKVLEFNVRFGDPECQPLLMRLKSDLIEIMLAVAERRLKEILLDVDPRPSACVVMAAGGYPEKYEKGRAITGLEKAGRMKDVMVFHSGTSEKDGKTVTAGGRVLGVTALGDTIEQAVSRAYEAVEEIGWEGAFYRRDIGKKAILRLAALPRVLIVMGSDSDLPVMEETARTLEKLGVHYEMTVASAHRTPEKAASLAKNARARGIGVIVAGAGAAAHLAGALAAQTTLPVIGVPIDATPLNGLDALLSTVQMPPGIPVATVAVGKMGAKNAGVLAAQILAVSDPVLHGRLRAEKLEMARAVEKKAAQIARHG